MTDIGIRKWVIYKIVNPQGRVYIGRTCDFKRRASQYRVANCHGQNILKASILKYGFDSHSMEIIDSFESNLSYANGKEIFWIRTYCSNSNKFDKKGMNCTDGGKGGLGHKLSPESQEKRRQTMLKNPRIWTEEERKRVSDRMKGHKYNKPGKKAPPGWVEKMRALNTGKKYPGRKKSKESVEAQAAKLRGRERPQWMKNVLKQNALRQCKPVLQFYLYGNFVYEYKSRIDASKQTGINTSTISRVLNGKGKSAGGFIFKYKDGSTPEFKPKRIPLTKEEKKARNLDRAKKRYQKNSEDIKEKSREYQRVKRALKKQQQLF